MGGSKTVAARLRKNLADRLRMTGVFKHPPTFIVPLEETKWGDRRSSHLSQGETRVSTLTSPPPSFVCLPGPVLVGLCPYLRLGVRVGNSRCTLEGLCQGQSDQTRIREVRPGVYLQGSLRCPKERISVVIIGIHPPSLPTSPPAAKLCDSKFAANLLGRGGKSNQGAPNSLTASP